YYDLFIKNIIKYCFGTGYISYLTTTLGIGVVKPTDATDGPENIGIVLEGQVVLHGLDNVALAAAMLFGLMYALNLNYPPELKYSFEVLKKVVMELDGNTLSKKA
uniref:Uncharacterized protein n=1 Tax=Gasterosteus aculeatus aculeatus TaxID=481459 RepID=A0AAQ4S5C2_GASAC